MPLTPFQKAILRVLFANRTPESHFAGGAVDRLPRDPRSRKLIIRQPDTTQRLHPRSVASDFVAPFKKRKAIDNGSANSRCWPPTLLTRLITPEVFHAT
jgi:hypothetical protein